MSAFLFLKLAIRKGKTFFEKTVISTESENSQFGLIFKNTPCQKPVDNPERLRDYLQAAGRLKHFDMNWEEKTNDLFILDIAQGFKIVFLSEPVQNCLLPPVQMNKEEVFLVDKEIQERLQKGQGQNSLYEP